MSAQHEMIKRTHEIVATSRAEGIALRIVGGCAIHSHCTSLSKIHTDVLGRRFRDADYIGRASQVKQIVRLFDKFGYAFDKYRSTFSESSLILFSNEEPVDIFLDKLIFNHTIDLRNRLDIDYPTIALADLLLQKLQIVEINEKDLQDILVLLAEHKIGSSDDETINCDYISDLLSDDWGFYTTCSINLVTLKDTFLERFPVSNEMKVDVREKIDTILEKMETHNKSVSWKLRAKVGRQTKWYTEVEERTR